MLPARRATEATPCTAVLTAADTVLASPVSCAPTLTAKPARRVRRHRQRRLEGRHRPQGPARIGNRSPAVPVGVMLVSIAVMSWLDHDARQDGGSPGGKSGKAVLIGDGGNGRAGGPPGTSVAGGQLLGQNGKSGRP